MTRMCITPNITTRLKNGTLVCQYKPMDILQKKLGKLEFRRKEGVYKPIFKRWEFVYYNKALLDEPVFDDKLADATASMWDICGKVKLCFADTINRLRGYKMFPIREASKYGMHKNAAYFVSREQPTDVRLNAYRALNEAIWIDRYYGTDSFPKLLDLLTALSLEENVYSELLSDLYVKSDWPFSFEQKDFLMSKALIDGLGLKMGVHKEFVSALDFWLLYFGKEKVAIVSGAKDKLPIPPADLW